MPQKQTDCTVSNLDWREKMLDALKGTVLFLCIPAEIVFIVVVAEIAFVEAVKIADELIYRWKEWRRKG